MIGNEAYCSLIQYCPDRFRAEGINVGVVLFSPQPPCIRARMTAKHARVRKMFGTSGRDLDALKLAKRAMESRLNANNGEIATAADLRSFIATRANDLRMTEPRLIKVTDVESELERLYHELVEFGSGATLVRSDSVPEALPPKLNDVIYRLSNEGRIWKPGKIQIPIRNRSIDIPYAYQNSTVNLVKPYAFTAKRAETQAASLAIDGDLIQRHQIDGKGHRLIVVSTREDPTLAHELSEHIEPLFREYRVRLVRSNEAEAFASEVEQQAH
ncbi:MAG TPA: DUF3037 domain-containing protein [Pirellulales bacterium]